MLWQFYLWYISSASHWKWVHMQLTDVVFFHITTCGTEIQHSVLLLVCHVTFVPYVFLLVVVVFNCGVAI